MNVRRGALGKGERSRVESVFAARRHRELIFQIENLLKVILDGIVNQGQDVVFPGFLKPESYQFLHLIGMLLRHIVRFRPVEFRMGSPPTEPDHRTVETPRRTVIARRFAIAAKEVTVEQFQRFLKLGNITIHRYQLSASDLSRYSPDPEGPWIAPDWYSAAHYCNWLSEQEGLPKDQWCYLPKEAGVYAEGMSIPADVLERTGYPLPTEAEWEYACRAGAVTSRYYGNSITLLDAYARYQANGKEHAWMCGSLFPNDLGLFDVLGNTFEWCQDNEGASKPLRQGIQHDIISVSESVVEKDRRILRGGSFGDLPANVRSANRNGPAPAYRLANVGFRPSRTYH